MSAAEAVERSAHATPAQPAPDTRRRLAGSVAVRVVVWSARLVGLLAVVSAVFPGPRHMYGGWLHTWLDLPSAVGLADTVLTLAAGVALLLLATGLRRRKRRAWWLAIGTTATLTVVNLLHGLAARHGAGAAAAAAALLTALYLSRRYFVALPDPGGLGRAVRVLMVLAGCGFGLVWLLLAVDPRRLVGSPGAGREAAHATLSLVGVTGPVEFRVEWLDDLTAAVGLTFGLAALVGAGYHLLRSPEPHPSLGQRDDSQLRTLLAGSGADDSLGYFALRRDKTAVFHPGAGAAVSYRVLAGVALASGDPLGDVGAWPGAIAAFLITCVRHGWVPAVVGCSERGATAWARTGLDALEMGDEAVLRTEAFTLQGRPMRGVRQSVARMQRAGYTVAVHRLSEVDAERRAALAGLAARWRGGESERGFSMALSRVGEARDPDAVLVVAERDGVAEGILQLVPWGSDGLSLDVMRRGPAADNGLNELMIAGLMEAAAGLGVRRVSLNFAVFRSALARGERIGAGPVARLWASVLRIASRWWQIESLYRFNAKFRPDWLPRFVMYPTVRDLPRILFAVLEAEGFGGRPPALLRLLRR